MLKSKTHLTSLSILTGLICLMLSCNAKPVASVSEEDAASYALGYKVEHCDGYTKVDIGDPWKKGRLLQRYLLVSHGRPIPEGMPAGTIIRVPIRNIVVYTAVHAAVLDELGVTDKIVGVCEARYMKVPAVIKRIEAGLIQDFGKASSPDIEKIITSGAEAIIASQLENGSFGSVEKTGIPIIKCTDYMETGPLGSAEWIKFLGLLIDASERADSIFKATEMNYFRLKALASNVTYRPKLMTEVKYGNTWYVSGGDSFMAQVFKDAGADYIFAYLPGTGGIPLSFETVLSKAINADVWLMRYNRDIDMSYEALRSDNVTYDSFTPFRNRHIYGCNTNFSRYYEEVPFHPDFLLEELIAIFHPDLLPEHNFRYYKPL